MMNMMKALSPMKLKIKLILLSLLIVKRKTLSPSKKKKLSQNLIFKQLLKLSLKKA